MMATQIKDDGGVGSRGVIPLCNELNHYKKRTMAYTSKKIKLHNFKEINSAFKSRISTWRHENVDGANKDMKTYLTSLKSDGVNLIKSALEQHRCLKVNLVPHVTLENLEIVRER